jgi:hypothetical protein
VCNFAGACDPATNAPTTAAKLDLTNLVGIAPQGMNTFAYGTPASLGTVCEEGVVAALYDCNARSSLYAATVLDTRNFGKLFFFGDYFHGQKLHRKMNILTSRYM